MQTAAPRLRIFAIMDEPALIEAVRDLERTCSSFEHREPPPQPRVRAEYEELLDAAREELGRRGAI